MMDFTDALDLDEQIALARNDDDDQRAYHEDQRRMLEQAEHLVNQLRLLGLITKHETALLNFFIK